MVRYELSYDQFQPYYSKIYRVVTQDKFADGMEYTPGTPYPALDALRVDFPQATISVLYANYGSQVTVFGKNSIKSFSEKKFIEQSGIFFADPQFFSVFHFTWLSGQPSVLAEPGNTVLSKKIAEKYLVNGRMQLANL